MHDVYSKGKVGMSIRDLKRKHANAWQIKQDKKKRREQMQVQDFVLIVGKKQIEVENLLAENFELRQALATYQAKEKAVTDAKVTEPIVSPTIEELKAMAAEPTKLELIQGGQSEQVQANADVTEPKPA